MWAVLDSPSAGSMHVWNLTAHRHGTTALEDSALTGVLESSTRLLGIEHESILELPRYVC